MYEISITTLASMLNRCKPLFLQSMVDGGAVTFSSRNKFVTAVRTWILKSSSLHQTMLCTLSSTIKYAVYDSYLSK